MSRMAGRDDTRNALEIGSEVDVGESCVGEESAHGVGLVVADFECEIAVRD